MDNILAKKFKLKSLLLFSIPNVIMMISLAMYTIVDGMFVSRILGTTALSSINMIYPTICFEMAIAIMIATGGSAIIAKKLGEGKQKEAQTNLSFLIIVEILLGIAIAILGNIFIKEILHFLGVNATQSPSAMSYAKILFSFAPAFFLTTAFQTFFVTAGRPNLGLAVTLLAGITNILLDYIFMIPLKMGIAGAALATGIGFCIPAIIGLIFFLFVNNNHLHFVKPKIDWDLLIKSCANGSSEMVTNLATAATTILFNFILLRFYGEDGVAAITIILYFQYIFTALYFGYSNGIAPIISFKYGEKDKEQLKSIFKHSIVFLIVGSILFNTIINLTIQQLLTIFTPINSNVYNIAIRGFTLYSFSFVVMGFGIFASSLFTSLSDGKTSAIISFSRTFVFIVGSVLIFPSIIGEVGIWIAVPIAEVFGLIVAIIYIVKNSNKYKYI